MEGRRAPESGKDEKQTTIPGMGDSSPTGKVVDFTAARAGTTKGKLNGDMIDGLLSEQKKEVPER